MSTLGQAAAPVRRVWTAAGLVVVLTVAVNALNYVRDAFITARMGAGGASDVLFAALILPGILQQILSTHTLAAALVAVYQSQRASAADEARAVVPVVLGGAALGLGLLAAGGIAFAPVVARGVAPEFGAAQQVLLAQVLRWLLPGAAALVWAGLSGAVLNAHGRFALPALTPGLPSVCVVLWLALGGAAESGVLAAWLAVGMGAAAVAHAGALLALRAGWRWPGWRGAWASPLARRVLVLSVPLLGYMALAQVVTLFERRFASELPAGAVTYLTLAQKTLTLPLFLITGSLTTVLFPRLAAARATDAFASDLARGLSVSMPLLTLCTLWLYGAAELSVTVLYGRGAFSAHDVQATAALLRGYAFTLVPAGVGLVCFKALHARQAMRFLFATQVVALGVYIPLAGWASAQYGALGLAYALNVCTLCTTGLQLYRLAREPGVLSVRTLLGEVVRQVPACVGAAACLWAVPAWLPADWPAFVRLAGVGLTSGGVFVGLFWASAWGGGRAYRA